MKAENSHHQYIEMFPNLGMQLNVQLEKGGGVNV
jgi:hypothetical protein